MLTKRFTKTSVAYWIALALMALLGIAGGIEDARKADHALQVLRHLGYPDYFAVLLGSAKLLGVVAILAPVPRALREWAYAGFTFDVSAAIFSLVASGDPVQHLAIPLLALVLTVFTYWMWRRLTQARA